MQLKLNPIAEPLSSNIALREIPSLSGLRAFASLTVLVFHVVTHRLPGRQAVTLFFVLSGFLITLRLLDELKLSHKINILGFYLRRARRLLPAYYVWLLLTMVLLTGRVTSEIAAAAAYASDYYAAWVREGLISHAWSLSVEEQFYLLWPALLLFLSRVRSGSRYPAMFAVIAAVQLARLFLGARYPLYFNYSFEVNLDALLMGCSLALWLKDGRHVPAFLFSRWSWAISVAGLGICGFLPEFWLNSAANTIAAYCSAALIIRTVHTPPAILNNSVAHALGSWSYGLYLYHVLVIRVYVHLVPGSSGGGFFVLGWTNRLVVIVLSIAAAWFSFEYVESPWLRRQRTRDPGPAQLAASSA
jgi:peptidoglycan/LPS O-acetylase OafA/YrhL